MLQELLKQYWNYDAFRPQQLEIIQSLLAGRDTLAVLPTGGGKSLCYQVPALAAEGTAIVISPLIALMKDQVQQLQHRGIPAAYLSSSRTAADNNDLMDMVLDGTCKLLYIAPERLLSERFLEQLSAVRISFLAVDEAHCISQWGHDFRPAYRRIVDIFRYVRRAPVIALTASATDPVKADILQQLGLKDAAVFVRSVIRDNLAYGVLHPQSRPEALITLLKERPGSSIVYCNSRKKTEETSLLLQRHGLDAQAYHAGMPKALRDKVQEIWTGSNSQVICATSAFGMGIDKPDVRTVIHMDIPASLEAYYQEAGRAGRDGQPASCVLLADENGMKQLYRQAAQSFPGIPFIRSVYEKVLIYLGIATGDGYQETCAFDAVKFIQQYQLPMYETIAAIRFLQREGYWQWNETETLSGRLMFTTDEYSVRQLQTINTKLYETAIAVLRLYGGVFSYPVPVDEFRIAKMMGINKLELDKYLQQLFAMGFIDYQPYNTDGALYLLQERLPLAYLKLNTRLYQQLETGYYDKLRQMEHYTTEQEQCRSLLLARYFSEPATIPCGICDNCQARNAAKISLSGFLEALQQQYTLPATTTLRELQNNFRTLPEGKIIEYLRFLNDEGRIEWNAGTGSIYLK